MKRPISRASLVCAALFTVSLSGCLPFLQSGGIDREIEGSYDEVFQATLEELRAREFPIKRVDREEGRIVTGRRPLRSERSPRPVETVDARIEGGDDAPTDLHLLFAFVDQVSGPPRPVPDDGDDDRADDVTAAALSRSYDASAVYDEYFRAIRARVQEASGSPIVKRE